MNETEKQAVINAFRKLGINNFDRSIFEHRLLALKYLEATKVAEASISHITENGLYQVVFKIEPNGELGIYDLLTPASTLNKISSSGLKNLNNLFLNLDTDIITPVIPSSSLKDNISINQGIVSEDNQGFTSISTLERVSLESGKRLMDEETSQISSDLSSDSILTTNLSNDQSASSSKLSFGRDSENDKRQRRIDEFRASHELHNAINTINSRDLIYPSGDPEVNRSRLRSTTSLSTIGNSKIESLTTANREGFVNYDAAVEKQRMKASFRKWQKRSYDSNSKNAANLTYPIGDPQTNRQSIRVIENSEIENRSSSSRSLENFDRYRRVQEFNAAHSYHYSLNNRNPSDTLRAANDQRIFKIVDNSESNNKSGNLDNPSDMQKRIEEFRKSHERNSVLNEMMAESPIYPTGDPQINRQKIRDNHFAAPVSGEIYMENMRLEPNDHTLHTDNTNSNIGPTSSSKQDGKIISNALRIFKENVITTGATIAVENVVVNFGNMVGLSDLAIDTVSGISSGTTATALAVRFFGATIAITAVTEVVSQTGIWLEKHKGKFISPTTRNSNLSNLGANLTVSVIQNLADVIAIPGILLEHIIDVVLHPENMPSTGNKILDHAFKATSEIPTVFVGMGLYNGISKSVKDIVRHGDEINSTIVLIAKKIADTVHSETGTRGNVNFSDISDIFSKTYSLNQLEKNSFSNILNSHFNLLTNNSRAKRNFANLINLSSQASVTNIAYKSLNPISANFGFSNNALSPLYNFNHIGLMQINPVNIHPISCSYNSGTLISKYSPFNNNFSLLNNSSKPLMQSSFYTKSEIAYNNICYFLYGDGDASSKPNIDSFNTHIPNKHNIFTIYSIQKSIEDELRYSSNPSGGNAYRRAYNRLSLISSIEFNYSDFVDVVSSTSLLNSYNGYTYGHSVNILRKFFNEIGGVAAKPGIIKGIKNTIDQVLYDENILAFKSFDGKIPFSDDELKQINHELYEAIFIHNTYPFFSLHFNNDGLLYPVIHPAFKDNLVGEVISLLDYLMKGYLNGGIYNPEFLKEWHNILNSDRNFLKSKLIDLKALCASELKDMQYISLRELMSKYNLESSVEAESNKDPNSIHNTKFLTSFRIIASQNKIQKAKNILLFKPKIDVFYSIDLTPEYKEYLEEYRKKYKSEPQDYQLLKQLYRKMADDVKENMPKLPICRDYFEMLGVISSICYQYTTLREMNKVPIIDRNYNKRTGITPKIYPHIPVRYYKHYKIDKSFSDLFNRLLEQENEDSKIYKVDSYLLGIFEQQYLSLSDIFDHITKQEESNVKLYKLNQYLQDLFDQKISKIPLELSSRIDLIIHNLVSNQIDYSKSTHSNIEKTKEEFYQFLNDSIEQVGFAIEDLTNNINKALSDIEELVFIPIDINEVEKYTSFQDKIFYIEEYIEKIYLQNKNNFEKTLKKIRDSIVQQVETLVKQNPNINKEALINAELENISSRTIFDRIKDSFLKSANKLKNIKNVCEEILVTHPHYLEIPNQDRELKIDHELDLRIYNTVKELLLPQISDPSALEDFSKKHHESFKKFLIDLNNNINSELHKKIKEINSKNKEKFGKEIEKISISKFDKYKKFSDKIKYIDDVIKEIYKLNETLPKKIIDTITQRVDQAIKSGQQIDRQRSIDGTIKDWTKIHIENLDRWLKDIRSIIKPIENSHVFIIALYKSYLEKNLIPFGDFEHSKLEIADKDYYKEAGDNFRIVGGCGMTFQNIETIDMAEGNELSDLIHKESLELSNISFKSTQINKEIYHFFKIKSQNQFLSHSLDYVLDNDNEQSIIFNELLGQIEQGQEINLSVTEIKKTNHLGMTVIHHLASFAEEKIIEQIVKLDIFLLSVADNQGNLPIHIAAMSGNTKAINYFLKVNPNLSEAKTKSDYTPVLLSVQKGQIESVKILLKFNVNINCVLPNGLNALYIAIQNNDEEMAIYLINNFVSIQINTNIDTGNTPLHSAVENELTRVALLLISKGADINVRRKTDGYTPFHLAAKQGNIILVNAMLISGKISVDIPLSSGKTALYLAAENGHLNLVQLLVENYKANVNSKNWNKDTPIIAALNDGYSGVAIYLSNYAEVNYKNGSGETASLIAIRNRNFEAANILVKRNEDINYIDQSGLNYIYHLIEQNEYGTYKELVESRKIDVNLKFNLESSLALAIRCGSNFIADYIISQNGKFIVNNGDHILDLIVKSDNLSHLKNYIKSNYLKPATFPIIDIFSNDIDYIRLICLSAENGSINCLKFLLYKVKAEQKDLIEKNMGPVFCSAVRSKKNSIINIILAQATDSNIVIDSKNSNIGHLAAELGLINIIDNLYDHDINFTAINKDKFTAFHLAILNDDSKFLKKLLNKLDRSKWPVDLLSFATIKNKHKSIKTLIKKKFVLNDKIEKKNNNDLISSIEEQNIEQVKTLLELGYSANKAMHIAVSIGNIRIIELLIEYNTEFQKNDIFSYAVKLNKISVINYFHRLGFGEILKQYSVITDNIYMKQALQGSNNAIIADTKKIVSYLRMRKIGPLVKILKNFPTNNSLININGIEIPLIFIIFSLAKSDLEFVESVLKILHNRIDPMIIDQNGDGLIFHSLNQSFNKSSVEEVRLYLDLIDKYFSKDKEKILTQRHSSSLSIMEIAAYRNDDELIKLLLKRNYSLASRDNSSLKELIKAGNLRIVKSLIKQKINLNIVDENRTTLLMIAASAGQINIIDELIKAGLYPEAIDINGNNALNYAIAGKNTEAALYLIKHTKNIFSKNRNKFTAFMLAAENGQLKVLKLLAKSMSVFDQVNKAGFNALHLAAQNGYKESVKFLINFIDINSQVIPKEVEGIQNKYRLNKGKTSLHLAAIGKKPEMLIMLIEKGAKFEQQDALKTTALEYAAMANNNEMNIVIKQLVDFYNNDVINKLMIASVRGNNINLLRELLLIGGNINYEILGDNLIHIAAKCSADKVMSLLIESQNIDLNSLNNEGDNALHLAANIGNISIMLQLIEAGIYLNTYNIRGETPIQIACQNNNYPAFLQLLVFNADFKTINNENDNSFDITTRKKFKKITELLFLINPDFLTEKYLSNNTQEEFEKYLLDLFKLKIEMNKLVQNSLHLAIKLGNNEAVRILCELYPDYTKQRDNSNHTPIDLAKSQKNTIALNIINQFQSSSLLINKNRKSESILSQIQKPVEKESNVTDLSKIFAERLKVNTDIADRFAKIFVKMPDKNYEIFLLNENQDNKKHAVKWLEFLEKIDVKSEFFKEFTKNFLSIYPGNLLCNDKLLYISDKLIKTDSNILNEWFFSYFRSVIITKASYEDLDKAFYKFKVFLDYIINSGNLKELPAPPSDLTSFQFGGENYLDAAIIALKSTKDKKNQIKFLDKLPNSKIVEEVFKNKVKFITKAMLFDDKIEASYLNSLSKQVYETYKPRAIAFIAVNNTDYYTCIINLFDFLDQIKDNSLSDNERQILAQICIESIKRGEEISESQMKHFVSLAVRLANKIGIKIFRELTNFHNQSINNYNSVFVFIIELQNEIDIDLFIKNSKGNLEKLKIDLEAKQKSYLYEKYPESNIDEVINRFSSCVKFPINKKELANLKLEYIQLNEYSSKLKFKTLSELTDKSTNLSNKLKYNPNNRSDSLKLLAIIREVMRHEFKIYPYNTQMLSVMALLNNPKEFKGRVGQIKTGEGKSSITAILATYLALNGHNIDIISSSQNLSIRDQKKFVSFYKKFNIDSDNICSSDLEEEKFNKTIIYGTNTDFEFGVLRRKKKIFDKAIVDEADNLFIDTAGNSARIALPKSNEHYWIYAPMLKYIQNNISFNIKDIREFFGRFNNGIYSKNIRLISDNEIKILIDSARKALTFQENKDYVVQESKNFFESPIIIVDYTNTGKKNIGSRWSNGIHQFVEVKHGFKPGNDSYTYAAISHPAFFKKYKNIYGLTGTIGEDIERQEIKEIYNLDTFDVPPHLPNKRKKLSGLYLTEKNNYLEAICNSLIELRKKNCPALALFRTIRESEEFSAYLNKKNIKHKLLNEQQQASECFIIDKAGEECAITIATNNAGRGTDIILTQESKLNGGLGVKFTFLASNGRVQDQGDGRAGRQGQEGTCQTILYSEDEEIVKLIPSHKERLKLAKEIDPISTIEKIRSIYIQSLSNERRETSKIDTILYLLVEQFFHDKDIIETKSKNLDNASFVSICENFNIETDYINIESKLSLSSLYKDINKLLERRKQGLDTNWNNFVNKAKETYISNFEESWSKLFDNLSNEKITFQSYKKYKDEIFKKYRDTTNIDLMLEDFDKEFKKFIIEILSSSTKFISQKDKGESSKKLIEITIHKFDENKQKLIEELGGIIKHIDESKIAVIKISSNKLLKDKRDFLGVIAGNLPFKTDPTQELDILGAFPEIIIENTNEINKYRITYPKTDDNFYDKLVKKILTENDLRYKNRQSYDLTNILYDAIQIKHIKELSKFIDDNIKEKIKSNIFDFEVFKSLIKKSYTQQDFNNFAKNLNIIIDRRENHCIRNKFAEILSYINSLGVTSGNTRNKLNSRSR